MAFHPSRAGPGPRPDRLVRRRPREITWGDQRIPVTRLAAVREEAAAYPVITGPRTLFEVETEIARLSLTYHHRSHRWTVTGLDEAPGWPPEPRTLPAGPGLPPPAARRWSARGGCAGTALAPSPTASPDRADRMAHPRRIPWDALRDLARCRTVREPTI